MKQHLSILFLAASAWGQPTLLRVDGTTPTQAILSYRPPDGAPCTIEVSESPTYSPVVNDVNAAYFAGSNADTRPGTVYTPGSRTVVAGAREIQTDIAGVKRSRALAAATKHYVRVTCTGGSQTAEFTTGTMPWGFTRGEIQPASATEPLAYNYPATNPFMNSSTVNPSTGLKYFLPKIQGWAFGKAMGTATTGVSFIEAAGNGWTPSSGSLTAAAASDDSAYAEYSGASADWLRLRLGTSDEAKFPKDNNHAGQFLAFQNLLVKLACQGSGCTVGGEPVEICPSFDVTPASPVCDGPVRALNVATAESTVRVCADAPCTTPNNPGDVMVYDAFATVFTGANVVRSISAGMIYNTGLSTAINFTNVDDCNRLAPNEDISVYLGPFNIDLTLFLASKNCAGSPPQATLTGAQNISHNGADGMPFFYRSGYNTARFGFLLRKKNPTANATIRLNLAAWRGAVTKGGMALAVGSGGFGKRCTSKPSSNGFYHCHTDGGLAYGLRVESDGSVTLRYLGFLFYRPDLLGVAGGGNTFTSCISGSSDFLWDDDDPNVFYCEGASNYPDPWGTGQTSRRILMKMTYTGNDAPAATANPDGVEIGSRWGSVFPVTAINLTPCLNACSSINDDYTPYGQMRRKAPAWDFTRFPFCTADAVTKEVVIYNCRSGQQDSWAVMFAMDLGNRASFNGGYVASSFNQYGQQVFGFNSVYDKRYSSFCGIHTYQSALGPGGDFAIYEVNANHCQARAQLTSTLPACSVTGNGTCAPCPAIIVDGVDYTGKNWCGTINLNSSWNGTWGVQPSGFRAGHPLCDSVDTFTCGNVRWLKGWNVGDFLGAAPLFSGSTWEMFKVIQVNSDSQLVVERGFGRRKGDSFYEPKAHSSGDFMVAMCAAVDENGATSNPELDGGGVQWFYKQDPDATQVGLGHYWTWFVNHSVNANGQRFQPKFRGSSADWTDVSQMVSHRATLWHTVFGDTWAGVRKDGCAGNSCESHPAMSQVNAPDRDKKWFVDIHPNLFGGNTLMASQVAGNLWKMNAPLAAKQYDIQAYFGQFPLRHVGAPEVTLSGGAGDHGKVCVAFAAGDCWSSSAPGEVYFNYNQFDKSKRDCRQAEFAPYQGDICAAEATMMHGTFSQWRIPTQIPNAGARVRNGQGARILGRLFRSYREAATENAKLSPDGKVALFRRPVYAMMPPLSADDSVNRATFVPVPVRLTAAPPGTASAIVRFGYDENLRCTANRQDACIAAQTGLNEANPYFFAAEGAGGVEGGLAGVPCASGCLVTIPAVSGRVLRYQIVYRDSGGVTQHVSPVRLEATP